MCPACSAEYKGDVWYLLRVGTVGGDQGVPSTVGDAPKWFLTLTGPGFGAVHGETCGQRRVGRRCVHGATSSCPTRHAPDDPLRGDPLCSDCYDYVGAVAFNWMAPELWRRFTIAFRRDLATSVGLTESALRRVARVSYAKVAEFQARGLVHFHAIVRIDVVDDGGRPVALPGQVRDALRRAAHDVGLTLAGGPSGQVCVRFGQQVDIREIRARTDAGAVGSDAVAAYIAKYATKAAEDFGLDSRIRTSRAAEHSGLRPHVVKMIATCEALQGIEAFNGVGGWAHMLGSRGHFTTKSRSFSTTLTALRDAHRHWRAARGQPGGAADGPSAHWVSTDLATDLPEIASSTR